MPRGLEIVIQFGKDGAPADGCAARRMGALVALAMAACMPARAGTMLLRDNFAGAMVNPALWHIPTWTPDGSTFVRRTQFRVTQDSPLPVVSRGNIILGLQTYNPSGVAFLGDELISNRQFEPGVGLDITYHAAMDAGRVCGIVGGLFLYGLKAGPRGLHDEIDFELLTNLPGQVQTNIYGNEPVSVGHPMLVKLPWGTIADYHRYGIRWSAGMVSWAIDGVVVRSTTQNVPMGPMRVYLNDWAPGSEWRQAYCAQTQPTGSARENVVIAKMAVDAVSVASVR